jgi:hypothetical protein
VLHTTELALDLFAFEVAQAQGLRDIGLETNGGH